MLTSAPYIAGQSLPDLRITWLDTQGQIIDLTQYTVSLSGDRLWSPAQTPPIIKASGFTLAATDPNLIISWSLTDLANVTDGTYLVTIKAVRNSDSRVRKMQFLLPVV